MDKSKPIEFKPNQSNNFVCEQLVYKQDSSDGYVAGIEDKNNIRFLGQDTCPSGMSTSKVTLRENPLFAPTHYIFDKAIMLSEDTTTTYYLPPAFVRLWSEYEPTKSLLEEKKFSFVPRIVYYAGMSSYSSSVGSVTYQTSDWKYDGETLSQFPHAYMINPYDLLDGHNMSFSKNVFRHIRGEQSSISGFKYNDSLYELYWEDFQERFLLNTTMTAYIKLGLLDIHKLSFRSPKHMLNARWILSSLKEWNPCLQMAKARLILAEKLDRDYITGQQEENTRSFVALGALNGNIFVELANAQFADWRNNQFQVAGEIRNEFSGDLQGPSENSTFHLDFTYSGNTDSFSWDYSLGEINFATDDPLTNVSEFSSSYRPFISGGLGLNGRLYFLFDKKAWAIHKGYSETIIPANVKTLTTPYTQNGTNGPAVELVVGSYMTQLNYTSATNTISLKPFITHSLVNNFYTTVELNSGTGNWEIIVRNKDKYNLSSFTNFDSVTNMEYRAGPDVVPPYGIPTGISFANPVSQVQTETPSPNPPATAFLMSGFLNETSDYIAFTNLVATYQSDTPVMAYPEYAYVNVYFDEDILPIYDSTLDCWKPTGTVYCEFVKRADSTNGIMYELIPSAGQITGGSYGNNIVIPISFVTQTFYEEDDVSDTIQAKLVINEPGLHDIEGFAIWKDPIGSNTNIFTLTNQLMQTYDKY